MALTNKVKLLSAEQVITIIKKTGNENLVDILNGKDLTGQKLLEMTEFDMNDWKLTSNQKKELLLFINELKSNSSKLLSKCYPTNDTKGDSTFVSGPIIMSASNEMSHGPEKNILKGRTIFMQELNSVVNAQYNQKTHSGVPQYRKVGFIKSACPSRQKVIVPGSLPNPYEFINDDRQIMSENSSASNQTNGDLLKVKSIITPHDSKSSPIPNRKPVLSVPLSKNDGSSKKIKDSETVNDALATNDENLTGNENLVDILNGKYLTGQKLLEMTEFDMNDWKLTSNQKKELLLFINELKSNSSKLLSKCYPTNDTKGDSTFVSGPIIMSASNEMSHGPEKNILKGRTIFMQELNSVVNAQYNQKTHSGVPQYRKVGFIKSACPSRQKVIVPGSLPNPYEFINDDRQIMSENSSASNQTNGDLLKVKGIITPHDSKSSPIPNRKPVLSVPLSKNDGSSKKIKDSETVNDALATNDENLKEAKNLSSPVNDMKSLLGVNTHKIITSPLVDQKPVPLPTRGRISSIDSMNCRRKEFSGNENKNNTELITSGQMFQKEAKNLSSPVNEVKSLLGINSHKIMTSPLVDRKPVPLPTRGGISSMDSMNCRRKDFSGNENKNNTELVTNGKMNIDYAQMEKLEKMFVVLQASLVEKEKNRNEEDERRREKERIRRNEDHESSLNIHKKQDMKPPKFNGMKRRKKSTLLCINIESDEEINSLSKKSMFYSPLEDVRETDYWTAVDDVKHDYLSLLQFPIDDNAIKNNHPKETKPSNNLIMELSNTIEEISIQKKFMKCKVENHSHLSLIETPSSSDDDDGNGNEEPNKPSVVRSNNENERKYLPRPPIRMISAVFFIDDEDDEKYNVIDLVSDPLYLNIDRKGCEKLLRHRENGAFLFRPSQNYFLVLTVKKNDMFCNFGIDRAYDGKIYLHSETASIIPTFSSLQEFINYYCFEPIVFRKTEDLDEWDEICMNPSLGNDAFQKNRIKKFNAIEKSHTKLTKSP
ncbi:uncharacterized protein isoform X3 [Leptinotarsa decemlineata]|uniref:uncharacterized protein isoform X3 n=1 Tax=Leptinotarsa decemlineata TaxID=7539 RepID=UPI003D308516